MWGMGSSFLDGVCEPPQTGPDNACYSQKTSEPPAVPKCVVSLLSSGSVLHYLMWEPSPYLLGVLRPCPQGPRARPSVRVDVGSLPPSRASTRFWNRVTAVVPVW